MEKYIKTLKIIGIVKSYGIYTELLDIKIVFLKNYFTFMIFGSLKI